MLRPTAISAKAEKEYTIKVTFDNGEVKLFDCKPYIRGEWYSQLENADYFKCVRVNGYSVEWPDGQDLCPDELYYKSFPCNE